MIYRDNKVIFRMFGSHGSYYEAKYKVGNGVFIVNDYCVSNGQDPDRHLTNTSYDIKEGQLVFSIGRHGTEAVAKWFNDKVNPAHNTFGHTAGVLNFAMIGTLKLDIHNVINYTTTRYTFNHIALAQGHTGGRNNWWFGALEGKEASPKNTTIVCTGIDTNGKSQDFVFKRGGAAEPTGQEVNEIEIFEPR